MHGEKKEEANNNNMVPAEGGPAALRAGGAVSSKQLRSLWAQEADNPNELSMFTEAQLQATRCGIGLSTNMLNSNMDVC